MTNWLVVIGIPVRRVATRTLMDGSSRVANIVAAVSQMPPKVLAVQADIQNQRSEQSEQVAELK